jgi:DNA gyrase subunit A
MCVIPDNVGYVLTATEGGFAKRTRLDEYTAQGRGGKGVFTMKIVSTRGGIVGALVTGDDDQLFAITSNGGVIRTNAAEVRRTNRQTMGVRLMNLPDGVTLLAVARNADQDENGDDVTALPADRPGEGDLA